MADDVEMTPVENQEVQAAEPPKVNPLSMASAAPAAAPKSPTPTIRRPTLGAGATLRPGLKLPPKPGLASGLKLPPKPKMATVAAKPLIRKPGATVIAKPLPKPVGSPVVPVDAQGVGKLPTVAAKTIDRAEASETPIPTPKPLEALKTVTQKLKGVTQSIPQQAILRKTGIIAETAAQTDAQKEAAKHKTSRISLSDAMGVAPVKETAAPMKTIRIKRPVNMTSPAGESGAAAPSGESVSMTQRKTIKISRGGPVLPSKSKFAIKKPVAAPPPAPVESSSDGEVADIPDLPQVAAPVPQKVVPQEDPFAVGATIAAIVKLVATVVLGVLVYYLYQNTQLPLSCGGLGWGA